MSNEKQPPATPQPTENLKSGLDSFLSLVISKGLLAIVLTGITVIAWNMALTPMFPMLPTLSIGYTFFVMLAGLVVKEGIENSSIEDLSAKIDMLMQMKVISHHNDLSQRSAMIELLNRINNKLPDGIPSEIEEIFLTEEQNDTQDEVKQ